MNQTIQERNKALVLDAFDTLFNKRDYAAAEKYWSPNYIQHSAHIEPGRDGLFNLIRNAPNSLRYGHPLIVGGTGIGRGLAEALHKLGNKVIISGRRKEHLDATTKANPGMHSVELDIADQANIAVVAKKLIADYPALNVLINNAGIMLIDD